MDDRRWLSDTVRARTDRGDLRDKVAAPDPAAVPAAADAEAAGAPTDGRAAIADAAAQARDAARDVPRLDDDRAVGQVDTGGGISISLATALWIAAAIAVLLVGVAVLLGG
jgi:hypothetical protein